MESLQLLTFQTCWFYRYGARQIWCIRSLRARINFLNPLSFIFMVLIPTSTSIMLPSMFTSRARNAGQNQHMKEINCFKKKLLSSNIWQRQ